MIINMLYSFPLFHNLCMVFCCEMRKEYTASQILTFSNRNTSFNRIKSTYYVESLKVKIFHYNF